MYVDGAIFEQSRRDGLCCTSSCSGKIFLTFHYIVFRCYLLTQFVYPLYILFLTQSHILQNGGSVHSVCFIAVHTNTAFNLLGMFILQNQGMYLRPLTGTAGRAMSSIFSLCPRQRFAIANVLLPGCCDIF